MVVITSSAPTMVLLFGWRRLRCYCELGVYLCKWGWLCSKFVQLLTDLKKGVLIVKSKGWYNFGHHSLSTIILIMPHAACYFEYILLDYQGRVIIFRSVKKNFFISIVYIILVSFVWHRKPSNMWVCTLSRLSFAPIYIFFQLQIIIMTKVFSLFRINHKPHKFLPAAIIPPNITRQICLFSPAIRIYIKLVTSPHSQKLYHYLIVLKELTL